MPFEGSVGPAKNDETMLQPWDVTRAAAQAAARTRYAETYQPDSRETDEIVSEALTGESVDSDVDDFDLSNAERIQSLRETMQAYVDAAEAVRTTAATTGYQGISYEHWTGEGCFSALQAKFDELDSVLAGYEEELQSGEMREISEGEYEDIQQHTDSMIGLSNAIVEAVSAIDVPAESVESVAEDDVAVEDEDGVEEVATELQQFVADTRQLYQVASSWFPRQLRTEEISEYLNGLLADAARAEDLLATAVEKDFEVLREQTAEVRTSTAAYEMQLRRLHDMQSRTAEEGVVEKEGVVDIPPTDTVFDEVVPDTLPTPEHMPTAEAIVSECTALRTEIGERPFLSQSELETLRAVGAQFDREAAAENWPAAYRTLENLQTLFHNTKEQPDPAVVAERTELLLNRVHQLGERQGEFVATVDSLAENLNRILVEDPENEARITRAYRTLEMHVLQHEDLWLTLGGMSLPKAGSEGVFGARSFREGLRLEVQKVENLEQKHLLNEAIQLLTVVPDGGLSEQQVARLETIARRFYATPHAAGLVSETSFSSADEEEVTAPKRGRLTVQAATTEEEEAVLPIELRTPEPPREVANLDSLEPDILEETWDYDLKSDSPVLSVAEETDDLVASEHVPVVTVHATGPIPVVAEPVTVEHAKVDADILDTVEHDDPINDVVPQERPTVRSWEARREAGSLAKKYISGELALKLKERGIEPRDLDRKIAGFVGSIDRQFERRFNFLEEPTDSVYATWRDQPLQAFDKVVHTFNAARRHELQEKYKVKYEALVTWADVINGEMRAVVADSRPDMTLGELVARYIAISETS